MQQQQKRQTPRKNQTKIQKRTLTQMQEII